MKRTQVINTLSPLSWTTGPDVLRPLMKAGDAGMPSGEIGGEPDMRPNPVCANPSLHPGTGLVHSTGHGCAIPYHADMEELHLLPVNCSGGLRGAVARSGATARSLTNEVAPTHQRNTIPAGRDPCGSDHHLFANLARASLESPAYIRPRAGPAFSTTEPLGEAIAAAAGWLLTPLKPA